MSLSGVGVVNTADHCAGFPLDCRHDGHDDRYDLHYERIGRGPTISVEGVPSCIYTGQA
jgi:hypothetical protein